ncbi:plasmid pRiA4b ORF-3 family protein [Arthrobacter sp. H14]|uniref:plasmid pRiA4b ORF-3 family protein n=1 Tax=Arthrobacter sp. H14 TaxID=1312959 RepID=UPI0004B9CA00|nr:plasmid pRiA4b ORF-3 family protein [Arthrobacter sp. H14]
MSKRPKANRPKANRPKTKNKSSKPKQQRHLQAVPSTPKPTAEERDKHLIDSFAPDFIEWFSLETNDPDGAMLCLNMAQILVEMCSELTNEATATSLPAWAVEEAIGSAYSATADEPGAAEAFVDSWHTYVHYLQDSGRWTGSDEEFAETHSVLSEDWDEHDVPLPNVDVPELSQSEEAIGFSQLELIHRTNRLLEWLGTGQQVTQTGALRRKDIEAAAACVGVRVKAGNKSSPALEPLPGLEQTDDESDESTVPTVRSMHDVLLLSTIWAALNAAGLISMTSTTVKPTAQAEQWLYGGVPEQVNQYRDFVTSFLLQTAVADDVFEPLRPAVASLMLMVLTAGTSEPVERSRLDDLMPAPEEERDMFNTLIVGFATDRLEQLSELGLLTGKDHYTVTPVVAQCVGAIVDTVRDFALAADDDFDDEFFDDPFAGSSSYTLDGITNAPGAEVWQLKIGLRGSKPPIWRRILVPSSIRLNELHGVIQLSFGWMDAHMHLFSTDGPYRGTVYRPAHPEFMEEGDVDESAVSLGEVLSGTARKLIYVYDFGDDWIHEIQLEDTKPDAARKDLPICTAGRGAAPVEDSGGIQGWMDKVEAANDASHEEHRDIREWLGLAPSETIDPKALDVDEINFRLSTLQ